MTVKDRFAGKIDEQVSLDLNKFVVIPFFLAEIGSDYVVEVSFFDQSVLFL